QEDRDLLCIINYPLVKHSSSKDLTFNGYKGRVTIDLDFSNLAALKFLMDLLLPEDLRIPASVFVKLRGARRIKEPLETLGIVEAVRGPAEDCFGRHLGQLGMYVLRSLEITKGC